MNIVDLLIITPILYFAYRGFVNGIIKEVFSIAGILLAVFLTFELMDPTGDLIRPLFPENASYIPFVSGSLIFIATVAAVQLAAFLLKKFLETINLNVINRISGLVFGFLKSSIVVSALLLLLAGFGFPAQQSRNNSLTYGAVIHVAPVAYNTVATLFPGAGDFTETVEETLQNYNPIKNFPTLEE